MHLKDLTTSEGIKNVGVMLSIVGTIYGVIHFGVDKIATYDGYADRLARIEASQIELRQVVQNDTVEQLEIRGQGDQIAVIQRRIENDAASLVDIRISIERLRALLGDRDR